MAQTPQGPPPAKPEPAAKPAPPAKPSAPLVSVPQATDMELENIVAKAERGGDIGDGDPIVYMTMVQAAITELARRRSTGEYGQPRPAPPPPVTAPSVPLGRLMAPTTEAKPSVPPAEDAGAARPVLSEAEQTRKYYEWLRTAWVTEHPERRIAYEYKIKKRAAVSSRLVEEAPQFNPDPALFLDGARAAVTAAEAAAKALEVLEQVLRDKFDAAARAMNFPGVAS